MIMICERCYAPIGDGEAVVRLAHVDETRPDGSVRWRYSYVHPAGSVACGTTLPPEGKRPDTGAWNPARGDRRPARLSTAHWSGARQRRLTAPSTRSSTPARFSAGSSMDRCETSPSNTSSR